jgi:hypothetical protein
VTLGRFARTLRGLHPLQIAARPPHAVIAAILRDVPTTHAPRPAADLPPPPEALRTLANAERIRGMARVQRLPDGSRLRAYEECYGMELGAGQITHCSWPSRVAVEPYPASVRARRIAVAMRCGAIELVGELARAARAVALQPELHLLGNHLLENGFGLVCAAAMTRGAEADLWWALGARLLGWQLAQQFLPDGGHVERSASYHLALTAALLESIELCQASRRPVPQEWRTTASRALGWADWVRAADGTFPLFNDAALDAAPDLRDVHGLATAVGIAPCEPERQVTQGASRCSMLQSTGWVRLETGDATLVVDAGPDASGWQAGHAHADGLSFELWVAGRRVIVDFGVASYGWDAARVETRATRSHNTVEIAGRDSCEVWGAFRLGRRGRGSVRSLRVRDNACEAVLEHDGYAWMPGQPRHKREITLCPRSLRITDRVVGRASGAISRLRLATPESLNVQSGGATERIDAVWHPFHGDPHPACLLSQRLGEADGSGTWYVEW